MNDLFTIKTLDFEEFEVCHQALSPLKVPLEQTPLWGDFDDSIANRSFLGSFRYDDAEGKMVAIASATLYQQKAEIGSGSNMDHFLLASRTQKLSKNVLNPALSI